MKNSYFIFILLYFICLNKGISQNKDTISHKNKKVEKPILLGYGFENKTPPNTISLKVAVISNSKTKKSCNQKDELKVTVKILQIIANGQGITTTFNKNKTEEFLVPLYLKEKIKKGNHFKLHVREELCSKTLNKSYRITKLLNKLN